MNTDSKKSKRYLGSVAAGLVAYFGVLLGYGFVFDPWQLFHKPWFRNHVFINNARFQNAGLINSYDFNSVILGSSMAENFSSQEASRLFGSSFINLSMAGSFFSERAIILERVFQKKNIEHVIITVDHLPNVRLNQFSADLPPEQYRFLYNATPLDDFRLYLDWKLLKCWNFESACQDELPGLRRQEASSVYAWHTYPAYRHSFEGVSSWCSLARNTSHFQKFLEELVRIAQVKDITLTAPLPSDFVRNSRINLADTFEGYLLPYIQNNPSTKFYFLLPPYTRVWSSMGLRAYQDNFWSYVDYIRYLVDMVGRYENAKIFGFDDMTFPDDISNYMDQSHFSADISSILLQSMAGGEHELRQDNVEKYIADYIEMVAAYDLKTLAHDFERCLVR